MNSGGEGHDAERHGNDLLRHDEEATAMQHSR